MVLNQKCFRSLSNVLQLLMAQSKSPAPLKFVNDLYMALSNNAFDLVSSSHSTVLLPNTNTA